MVVEPIFHKDTIERAKEDKNSIFWAPNLSRGALMNPR
jgi:hypothetical protein